MRALYAICTLTEKGNPMTIEVGKSCKDSKAVEDLLKELTKREVWKRCFIGINSRICGEIIHFPGPLVITKIEKHGESFTLNLQPAYYEPMNWGNWEFFYYPDDKIENRWPILGITILKVL